MSRISIAKNLDELMPTAAELFAQIVNTAIATRGRCSVSLSGGSTPRFLYAFLSSEYRNAIDWYKVRFFLGDDRNVLPDATDSNYRMARETLLDRLGIAADNIERWLTEIGDVDEAARRYEKRLELNGPIDLMLLGLGADGHTASLFPHTAAIKEAERLAVANWVERMDAYRLTMTFPAINRSANVVFLVTGEEKAEAVYQVLKGKSRPEEYPAQLVKPESGTLYWLLDEAAAGRLGAN